MRNRAAILELEKPDELQARHETRLHLPSGRGLLVHAEDGEERIEISEASGQVTITVRLTGDGPVFLVEGASLALKAPRSISLEAPQVVINASEQTTISSQGGLAIAAKEGLSVDSEDEIRLQATMIHLN